MAEEKITDEDIVEDFVQNPYKYGFKTNIETESFPKGLNRKIINDISRKKDEPDFLKNFRIKSYEKWKKMEMPNWSSLNIPEIDYQDMQYYSIPKTKKKLGSLDEVEPELLETFNKLGISLTEQKLLSNVAVDAVFDSVSIGTTFKKQLHKFGVIFCSFSEAVEYYPNLVEKY